MNITLVDSIQLHIFMILLVIASVLLIITYRNNIINCEEKFSKKLGLFTLTVWVIYNIYNFLPSNFNVAESLPLHLCDVLAFTSILVLLRRNKKASSFLYFCALPLASQAIITPTGEQNPLLFRFWLFWILHASIIVASIYDLVIRKYRPSFKSYLFTLLCDISYVLVILPINVIFDFNYGFIGNSSPEVPTMIDVLGTWPLRVLWIVLAVALVQFAMYIPWAIKKIVA